MDPTFVEVFKENPIWISLAILSISFGLLCALVGVVLAVKQKTAAAMVLGGLAVLAGAAAAGAGGIGWWQGRAMTEATLSAAGLSASDRARLRAAGDATASYSAMTGAGGLLPLLGGVAAVGLGLACKKR